MIDQIVQRAKVGRDRDFVNVIIDTVTSTRRIITPEVPEIRRDHRPTDQRGNERVRGYLKRTYDDMRRRDQH